MDQRWPNVTSRRFVESAAALQLPRTADFNGPRNEGFGLYQVTQKGGERWSEERAYIDTLRGRANFAIRTRALFETIVFEDGHATGGVTRRGPARERLSDRTVDG